MFSHMRAHQSCPVQLKAHRYDETDTRTMTLQLAYASLSAFTCWVPLTISPDLWFTPVDHTVLISVWDPHVFGPSGSTCQMYGSGSFPFPTNMLSKLKKCLTSQNFNTKCQQKIKFLRLKIMYLWVSYKKKYDFFILKSLKSQRKQLDPDSEPDQVARGTDPGIWIRIRTKMSRIPNTGASLSCRNTLKPLVKFNCWVWLVRIAARPNHSCVLKAASFIANLWASESEGRTLDRGIGYTFGASDTIFYTLHYLRPRLGSFLETNQELNYSIKTFFYLLIDFNLTYLLIYLSRV